ncbi:VanZ family protein [Paenibacillus sp. 1_12]|uniref:VanZ family protein n=1 Tax=Paenibacillus sp. 1_12 TaxID=1566278 RepID=UPI000B2FD642|nr:VanZ family protein [Paenibacillus sp. 1_12]
MTSKRLKKLYRDLAILMFAGYGSFMCYLLFFGFSRNTRTERMMNLIPFKTISNYITGFHHYNLDTWVINLFGNVAAFVPFGFLVPLVFPGVRSYLQIISRFLLALLAVESIQWVFHVGSFDVDDILLNVIGGLIGFAILQRVRNLYKR